jgi:hypothetical protein
VVKKKQDFEGKWNGQNGGKPRNQTGASIAKVGHTKRQGNRADETEVFSHENKEFASLLAGRYKVFIRLTCKLALGNLPSNRTQYCILTVQKTPNTRLPS